MKTAHTRHRKALAALVGLTFTIAAQAAEFAPRGYVMTVYENMSGGSAILDGATEDVIPRLVERKDRGSSFLANQVNLCVAYAKATQIDAAADACDSAITASVKEAKRLNRSELFGRRTARIADTGRAIALTNRGVLHALEGEVEKARTLFELAIELDSAEESAKHNLVRLENKLARDDT